MNQSKNKNQNHRKSWINSGLLSESSTRSGLYREQRNGKPQYLYVNRGLGVIGYPGRIGILPEITLMELVS